MPPPAPQNIRADPVEVLRERFAAGIVAAFPQVAGEADPLISPSKQAENGDFQSNAAMGLAKRLGKPPREVAQAIVRHVDVGPIAEPLSEKSIAGPGFINIRLRSDALAAMLEAMDDADLGVARAPSPLTVVVDLMGVNLAKQMHVGHLRSPIIGDAIARCLERLGHKVIRQNHVGDWGVNIAMTTARVMRLAADGRLKLESLTLDDLDRAYSAAQRECERDLAGLESAKRWNMGPKALAELEAQVEGATQAFSDARQTLLKLQAKDPATYAVWRRIYEVTMQVCVQVCAMLHVRVTEADSAGESSYADELGPMVADLEKRGVAVPDQGALVVRLDNPPPGEEPIKEPALIRKSDGGYLYATTDVAAIRRRVQKLGADRVIYAIDARQSLHMKQVFAASRRAGYATNPRTGRVAVLEHAAFGAVLGEDGRPFKTRSGESVKLADLIGETFERAQQAVRSRNRDLSEEEAMESARAVGIAALKYADLSNDRMRDYVFSFDRMLAFEGNTGPYLLNALVRIKSIFRKGAEKGLTGEWKQAPLRIADPKEKALTLVLLRYAGALEAAAATFEPHRLCQFLYDLAGAFASFYEACPVLAAPEPAVRDSRLRLCDLTARVLEDGMRSLGIPAAERM